VAGKTDCHFILSFNINNLVSIGFKYYE